VLYVVESLGEFASRKRGARSRQDVCDQAKRKGYDISQAYIQKIETGETKSPSLDKLDALAAGLGVDPDYLVALARGKDPEAVAPESGSALAYLDELADLAHPPSLEERRIIKEAESLSLFIGMFTEPGFWSMAPETRRRFFRDVEGAIDEARDMYRRMGKELPNGS
jgi:transcriptional regulator with XRE-family HTH domain